MFKKLKALFGADDDDNGFGAPPTREEVASFRLAVNRSSTTPNTPTPRLALLACNINSESGGGSHDDAPPAMSGMQYVACWGCERLLRACVAAVERSGKALPPAVDLRHAGEERWFPWLLVKHFLVEATPTQRALVLQPLGIVDERLNVLLMDAVRTNHADCVAVLIRRGANVNYKAAHNEDMTPLCKAASLGYEAMCATLLDCGARVNDVDVHGCSALHWAARKGHRQVYQLLVQRGGDAELRATQTYGFKTPQEMLLGSE